MPNPIPKGLHTVTPYLVVPDAAKVMGLHTARVRRERAL
jgi:hypothetical protein